MEMNELNSKKGSKKDDDDEFEGKDKKKKKNDEKDEIDKDNKKKKMRKKGGGKQNKIQQQRNEKKKAMAKFFFHWNIFFTLKVMGILVIGITYYIVIMLIEYSEKDNYLEFYNTTNSIEGIYKQSYDIFLIGKAQLQAYENTENNIRLAIIIWDYDPSHEVIINGVKYNKASYDSKPEIDKHHKMTIPSNSDITSPKLGNLLMPLVSDGENASEATIELNNGYSSDSCLVLFGQDTEDYKICAEFWSSILIKGMEQSIIQMSVIINTVIDELNSLNNANIKLEDVTKKTSSFSQYEMFVGYYLGLAYTKTIDIFTLLKEARIKSVNQIFNGILYVYAVGVVLGFFVGLYFVYSSKYVFNSFGNFIGILPVKYLVEDDSLYKDILKLEQHIF